MLCENLIEENNNNSRPSPVRFTVPFLYITHIILHLPEKSISNRNDGDIAAAERSSVINQFPSTGVYVSLFRCHFLPTIIPSLALCDSYREKTEKESVCMCCVARRLSKFLLFNYNLFPSSILRRVFSGRARLHSVATRNFHRELMKIIIPPPP